VVIVIKVLKFLRPGLTALAIALGAIATVITVALLPGFVAMAAASAVAFAPLIAGTAAAVAAIAGVSLAVNHFAMDFGEMGDRLHEVADKTGATYDTVKDLTRRFMDEVGLSFEEASTRAETALTSMPEMTKTQMDATVAAVIAAGAPLSEAGAQVGGMVATNMGGTMAAGAGEVEAGADAMMEPLPDEVAEAGEEAVEIASFVPGSIAGALMNEDELTKAAEELRDRILNPFIDLDRRAFIETELASQAVADGLRSKDSDVVDSTIAYVNDLVNQYEAMEPGALAAGSLVNPALKKGMDKNVKLAVDTAAAIAKKTGTALEFDASVYGTRTILGYISAIRRQEMNAYWAANAVAKAAARGIEAHSPPTDPNNPLRHAALFAERSFEQYAIGIEKTGPRIRAAVVAALSAGAAMMAPGGFPTLAGEGGPTLAQGAAAPAIVSPQSTAGSTVIHKHYNVNVNGSLENIEDDDDLLEVLQRLDYIEQMKKD
jgi:uncharacterized cupredoxin-like copper-binding protein